MVVGARVVVGATVVVVVGAAVVVVGATVVVVVGATVVGLIVVVVVGLIVVVVVGIVVVGTPVVGTPVVGTPVVGTPVVGAFVVVVTTAMDVPVVVGSKVVAERDAATVPTLVVIPEAEAVEEAMARANDNVVAALFAREVAELDNARRESAAWDLEEIPAALPVVSS